MLLVADVLSFQGDIPDDALKDWTDGVKAFHEARTKAPSDRDDPAPEAAARALCDVEGQVSKQHWSAETGP